MKKVVALFCVVSLLLGTIPVAFAATSQQQTAANSLYWLGLFKGTGITANGNPIFSLDKSATRDEAVTMLVRLLGKEEAAKNENGDIPFDDVETWAKPYVGYAYQNKLTSGISTTKFGGTNKIKPEQYITFVLRALGYEEGVDFFYSSAWDFSDKLGITAKQYNMNTKLFTRGDIAYISYNAIKSHRKNSSALFIKEMTDQGIVQSYQVDEAGLLKEAGLLTLQPPINFRIEQVGDQRYLRWDQTQGYAYKIQCSKSKDSFRGTCVWMTGGNELKLDKSYESKEMDLHYNCYFRIRAEKIEDSGKREYSEYSSPLFYNTSAQFPEATDKLTNEIMAEIGDYLADSIAAVRNATLYSVYSSQATSTYTGYSYEVKVQNEFITAEQDLKKILDLCGKYEQLSTFKGTIASLYVVTSIYANTFPTASGYMNYVSEVNALSGELANIFNEALIEYKSVKI